MIKQVFFFSITTIYIFLLISKDLCCQERTKEYYIHSDSIISFIDKQFKLYPNNLPYRTNDPIPVNYYTMIDERYNQFEYILGDSICMYDGFMKKNVIKTLKFGDKVYVPRFKNENAKFLTNFWLFHKDPKTLWYYLCISEDNKIGYINGLNIIPPSSIQRILDNEFLIYNGNQKIAVVRSDFSKTFTNHSHHHSFSNDSSSIIFSNKQQDNIILFDIPKWEKRIICKGVSASFLENDNNVVFWSMDRINGNINQSIKILELSSGIARSIFNVPEGFSLIGQHEDGISPYQFDFDINNKGVIRIYLC